MATQPGSGGTVPTASIEDSKGAQLVGVLRAYLAPNQTPAQKKANEAALQRALRAIGLNDEQAKELTKALVALPADQLAKNMALMQQLATEQANMSIKAANEWMNANIQQGKSISGIASFARLIATVARYFGAEDFAKTLDDKSDELMADAKKYFERIPADDLAKRGKDIADKAFLAQIQSLADKSQLVADTTQNGTKIINRTETVSTDGVTGQDNGNTPPPEGNTPPPAARHEIIRKQFRAEVYNITGNEKIADAVTKSTFDLSSNIPGTKKGVVDSPIEEIGLARRVAKDSRLTEEQKDKLYKKLNLAAPEPTAP